MFSTLEQINTRPEPFQYYTADELWTNEHTSAKMLEFHLNETIDVSSRNRKFIIESVNWISSYFNLGDKTNIIDFGCGPGLYTTLFGEQGANVTGIDFSERSINYAKNVAREKNLEIDYVLHNYLTFKTDKKFDLIIMIMCDFCALSPTQRKTLLQKFHKLLKPNGAILLDVYSLESFNQSTEQAMYEVDLLDGFWSPEKYYGFLNTFKYDDEKVILDKFTIVEKSKTRVVYNWLQYFSTESLIAEFKENNFDIEYLYSDLAGSQLKSDSKEIAIIAKKSS
ncbi:class I SAM-dependent methyltransferase [candidate division KSB1 bacterium]|nr:class I SAM-dependent methyltransferase [candidate division KSB1 bacterium]